MGMHKYTNICMIVNHNSRRLFYVAKNVEIPRLCRVYMSPRGRRDRCRRLSTGVFSARRQRTTLHSRYFEVSLRFEGVVRTNQKRYSSKCIEYRIYALICSGLRNLGYQSQILAAIIARGARAAWIGARCPTTTGQGCHLPRVRRTVASDLGLGRRLATQPSAERRPHRPCPRRGRPTSCGWSRRARLPRERSGRAFGSGRGR